MIFSPFGLRPSVMVVWSKIFDHDHGRNFKITMVKWPKPKSIFSMVKMVILEFYHEIEPQKYPF